MKTTVQFILSLLLLSSVFGKEHNTLSEEEKAEGWKLLFDGKTTNGWIRWGAHKPLDENSKWQVVEGALSLTGKGGGDIYTKESFENYELVMESSSEYAGVSVQSDISDNTDVNYIFREPNWNIIYDQNNNALFQEAEYNKYLYNSAILIETIIPPPPPIVFNSYRCTEGGCEKKTTKTKEQKTFVQRYSSLFNVDFRLASKVAFDCNK